MTERVIFVCYIQTGDGAWRPGEWVRGWGSHGQYHGSSGSSSLPPLSLVPMQSTGAQAIPQVSNCFCSFLICSIWTYSPGSLTVNPKIVLLLMQYIWLSSRRPFWSWVANSAPAAWSALLYERTVPLWLWHGLHDVHCGEWNRHFITPTNLTCHMTPHPTIN